jgi:hypothetical protein
MKPRASHDPSTAAQPRHLGVDEPMHPVQIAGFRKMSIAQKFDMITTMREQGIQLRIIGMRMRHPDWSEEKLEAEARRAAVVASTD